MSNTIADLVLSYVDAIGNRVRHQYGINVRQNQIGNRVRHQYGINVRQDKSTFVLDTSMFGFVLR
jgi:hypothetical protein